MSVGSEALANSMNLSGRTAIVTGAASGIGQAISISLAKRGCHLILADVNKSGLGDTVSQAVALGVKAEPHRVDVSKPEEIAAFAETVLAAHPKIDLLVNNAGVALSGTFDQVSPEDFDWLMSINFWGVVRMTRAFLPRLKQSDDARIVNLSSIFGIIAPPGQTAYCASKFAVRGFSESLRNELEEAKSNVGVTVVHPGGVATQINVNTRAHKGETNAQTDMRHKIGKAMLSMPPPQAGEIIVSGVEARKVRVLVGSDARQASVLERLMPTTYWKLIGGRVAKHRNEAHGS
jgi:NAD(P)-dependent dehydrogenase (short-subunit alcohol dehydrogenase family)